MDKPTLDRRDRRRLANATLDVVATAIGVSESTLHRWERGSRRPTSQMEKKWDAALAQIERRAAS
jgi:DNA-binding transcriptional regulator YiaG